MKFKKIAAVVLSVTLLPTVNIFGINASAASGTTVVLDPSEESPFNDGEFQGWGTSLCWWANRLGYSESLTEQAAEAFFSDDGLSLDIARYNLGGGDDPTHDHITRSDSKVPGVWETFELSEDGTDVESITYDLSNDQNQLNIAKAALEANPNLYFEGFSNSAPYFMTNSGCSSGAETASEDNLNPDMYDDFAEFIADATALFAEEGIVFQSYSPMNEPDTSYWGANSAKQEGCHFEPGDSQSNMITALRTALDNKGLTDVIVAGMDETSINSTVTNYGELTPEAVEALGRIDTHTYSGSNRSGLKALAEEEGKNLWMSEVDGSWNGLGLAERIILDMNGMMPSAWIMWDIVDSHKDSSFQTPDGTYSEASTTLDVTGKLWGVGMADHDTETLYLSNKYYAFGQFTRYIEPGDTIIASSDTTLAAYNKTTGDIKIVALNSSSSDLAYTFDLSAFTSVGDTVQEIRTNNLTGDSAEHWAEIEGEATLADKKISTTLKANTVTTYVVEGSGATDYAIITGGGSQIKVGSSVSLSVESNLDYSSIVWSSSDESVATVTEDGTVTAHASGTVTIYAQVDDMTISKTFEVPNYVLTGTASWGNDSNAPADSADYTQVADGDFSTYFDGTTGGWVQYDYGERYKVSEIKLAARSGDSYVARTVGGTVQGSNDAITWTDLYKITTAIPADEYTTITADELYNQIPYRYYRYTNTENMANIAEFLIEGEASSEAPAEVTKFEASSTELSYAYEVSDDLKPADATEDYHKYFAVYDSDNKLKCVTIDEPEKTISGDFTDASFKLFVWDRMDPVTTAVSMIEPVVTDLSEFTDDFEGNEYIFEASAGSISDGGNVVFASGLDRYGNVFAPVKSTATATLSEPVTITSKDKFRLTFTMFAGWESNGKENEFVLNDADGNELVALKLTGGGYNFNEIRIGGENVLSETTVSQSRCKAGSGSKTGSNGWDSSDQPYVNTVGYNKTVEITIDGAGNVTVSATGGMEDTEVTGTLTDTVTLGSMVLTGNYNSSASRTVTYDNFDADLITYNESFKITEPEATPEPTEAPVLPESGELISLSFDNKDLTSTSSYGMAEGVGTPAYAEVDDRVCLQLDGTNTTAIKLTDANGNPLLTGQENLTISFSVKPTSTSTSWWFYAAPSDSSQTYQSEKYIGALGGDGTLTFERYNNSGSRSASASGAYTINDWNDVIISVDDDKTDIYVNGELVGSEESSVNISDMLGSSSVVYIGKANWGTGEYATGYIDDFVITNTALENPLTDISLGDTTAVTADITIPTVDGVTWTTSDESVVTAAGVVTRADDTKTATLTATTTVNGVEFTKTFTVTVLGTTAVLDTFAAYADGTTIYFTSNYDSTATPYSISVSLYDENNTATALKTVADAASGSFAELTTGNTYKVVCSLLNGSETVKSVTRTVTVKEEEEMAAYLFVHFAGSESSADDEQIYFSLSTDGTTWTTVNDGEPVLTSSVGEEGVRDPYILRGEDGKFFIIATDLSIYNRSGDSNRWSTCQTSGSQSIVVWESEDLVNWSKANLVKVALDTAGCTWAPEAVYDAEKGQYMVFWASKVSDDDYATQRVYRSYTSDFETFSDPEVYIDGDTISNIDTTITSYKGIYYRFTKNESKSTVIMEKSASLSGTWEDVDTYTLGDMTGYEGPTIYKLNGEDKWCLLLDYYSASKGYKPFVTDDISTGSFTAASDFSFDATYRHGTVIPITQDEYDAIIAKYTTTE
ncbi:MAG: Ig-like domain-containing protein [Firmicutes bacterium]|nr:Ig-like domain-containing protein [Bacillota bacterium]